MCMIPKQFPFAGLLQGIQPSVPSSIFPPFVCLEMKPASNAALKHFALQRLSNDVNEMTIKYEVENPPLPPQ